LHGATSVAGYDGLWRVHTMRPGHYGRRFVHRLHSIQGLKARLSSVELGKLLLPIHSVFSRRIYIYTHAPST
jgi:hypothetical protein